MIMSGDVEDLDILTMLRRAIAARIRAEADGREVMRRLAMIADANQRALSIAYLAKLNRDMVEPQTLIACLTGRDMPHDARTTTPG